MSDVILESVVKRYEEIVAVNNVSLQIANGELVALLGPSGCGKTTLLRMIGGFVEVTEGRIRVGGKDVTSLPPNRRNMGFGFQNYALFPHMSVSQNVAFGLEMRRFGRKEIESKVAAALQRVRLGHLSDRLPKQLSGGQQQRVALARALIIEPDVLLLDEPLSNLDAQLRHEMKGEIRALQRTMGITTVFVTHDQDEALSVADRVVVMRSGRIEQDGTPSEVFEGPSSHFVAEFMGVTNLLEGSSEGLETFRLSTGESVAVPSIPRPSGSWSLALRPERIDISGGTHDIFDNQLIAIVEVPTYRGLFIDYRIRTELGLVLTVRCPAPAMGGPPALGPGQRVMARWSRSASHLVRR
jgi:putative spermidine/putrescine transport system ATP-binding protein